jgi:hypothetical protein
MHMYQGTGEDAELCGEPLKRKQFVAFRAQRDAAALLKLACVFSLV